MMEHPAITNAIHTGYPEGEPTYPHCPVCGSECDEVYTGTDGIIFACDECLYTHSAWETEECF